MLSAIDVMDALHIEGPRIDIVLAEVDLLVADGARILKYVMQNIELKHIPLISKHFF